MPDFQPNPGNVRSIIQSMLQQNSNFGDELQRARQYYNESGEVDTDNIAPFIWDQLAKQAGVDPGSLDLDTVRNRDDIEAAIADSVMNQGMSQGQGQERASQMDNGAIQQIIQAFMGRANDRLTMSPQQRGARTRGVFREGDEMSPADQLMAALQALGLEGHGAAPTIGAPGPVSDRLMMTPRQRAGRTRSVFNRGGKMATSTAAAAARGNAGQAATAPAQQGRQIPYDESMMEAVLKALQGAAPQ